MDKCLVEAHRSREIRNNGKGLVDCQLKYCYNDKYCYNYIHFGHLHSCCKEKVFKSICSIQ